MNRRASILYSYASIAVEDAPYLDGPQSRGVYDPEHVSAVYPVNHLTGLPETDGGKIADPYLTHSEREKVMSRLSGLSEGRGTYLPTSLSDAEVLELVPPRYVQDAVDVQRWRDYLSTEILPYMSDEVQSLGEVDTPTVETTEKTKEE